MGYISGLHLYEIHKFKVKLAPVDMQTALESPELPAFHVSVAGIPRQAFLAAIPIEFGYLSSLNRHRCAESSCMRQSSLL
jgi:hypothetical protein